MNWKKLIYIHYDFNVQNSGFLIYAWNALGGGVGGEVFTIFMAAEITVHVSFKLTHGIAVLQDLDKMMRASQTHAQVMCAIYGRTAEYLHPF